MNTLWQEVLREKSLEELQGIVWGDPTFDSYLVQRTHAIRKIPLKDFTVDDVAMMIRRGESLDFMMPLALEHLQKDILTPEGDYEGVLMNAVLGVGRKFWKNNQEYWNLINDMLNSDQSGFDFDRTFFDSFLP